MPTDNVRRVIADLAALPISPHEAALAARRALSAHHDVDMSDTVTRRVSHWATVDPDRLAVLEPAGRVTYGQLAADVAAVRDRLVACGCRPGEVVAVVGSRCALSVVVLLALECLGGVYLPVDAAWPAERQTMVLRRSHATHVLYYNAQSGPPLATVAAATTVDIPLVEVSQPMPTGHTGPAPVRHLMDDEPRYVFFTSGSTGVPRGALAGHRGMVNHLWAKIIDLGLAEDDVVAFTSPLTFDISVWQMLAPLMIGAAVAVFPDQATKFPRSLTTRLVETRSTVVELVPTMLEWLAAGAALATLPWLRTIVSTGEELRPVLAGRLQAARPDVRLVNAYGFTETADDVTHHVVRPDDLAGRRIPVGSPVINVVLYVLVAEGEQWRAAEIGEPGELFVGGIAPGYGYVADDNATHGAFFHDSIDRGSPTGRLYRTKDVVVVADGTLQYLGRLDRQVKVSGVRMELGEIEAVLSSHPAVSACAVLAPTTDGRRELVAYYVPVSACDETSLRDHLSARLPAAMVPKRWRECAELPVNANGKTDYQALSSA